MVDASTCPVKCLGSRWGDGWRYYIFRDVVGQERKLTWSQMTRRPDIVALFGGDISWLKSHFPYHTTVMKSHPDGSVSHHRIVSDFMISDAANWLVSECLIQASEKKKCEDV
ncbi:hypothetical protein S101468_00737 [Acetobacter pasteurianus subsp. pasteurianus]|uniref:Uncharacterized protein n=2 Tax=Acetobacter pasteurianus TaxID=438 RepID=A0AAC9X211_ACEPA|nr:hypothetical protein S101468_00737 [Acetobacter pasteurianus subsp. pasteurianus]